VEACGGKPSLFADSDRRDERSHTAPGGVAVQSAPLRKDIPSIAKAANGAIVSIVMSDKDGKAIAQGSGFVVSKDGMIVTNYHVIAEGSSAVVKLPDGAVYLVDGVLASDKARDVAVIKAHGENFRTLTLGNSDRVQVGEEVVAIGNPLSLESTVSNGIVSAIRTVEDKGGKFVQITAPISPGSSGGPLFNLAGEVVGITSAGIKGGENLNFAIPINDVKPLISSVSRVRSAGVSALPDEPEQDQAERVTAGPVTAAQTRGRRSFEELVNHKDGGVIDWLDADAAYVCFPPEEKDEFFIASYYEPKKDRWETKDHDILRQEAASAFVFYINGQRGRAAWGLDDEENGWHVLGTISLVGGEQITKISDTDLPDYSSSVNGFTSSKITVDGTEMRLHDQRPDPIYLPIDITIQLSTGRFMQTGVDVPQVNGHCDFYRHGKRI
jgi:S1-C subfamily serine protease